MAAIALCGVLVFAGCGSDPDPETTSTTLSPLDLYRARLTKVTQDATALEPLLNQFWIDELSAVSNVTFDPPDRFLSYATSGWDPCIGSSRNMTNNAFYCSADGDEKVEYDVNWLSSYLVERPGGATTFVVIAHEWGHAVQDTWTDAGGDDVWNPPYRKELNADCLAGVFISRSIANGTILEEEGDADAIFAWLFEGGSVDGWLNPGDHGSPEQRQGAFSDGVINGTAYCRVNY
jgi:hypothetical protein